MNIIGNIEGCGIYCIECIVNGKKYIGSSCDINRRYTTHIETLRKGEHINIVLQRAYDKYGEENFNFSVIELCEKIILFEREDFFMDELNSKIENGNGYNIAPANGGDMLTNHPDKDEIIKKRSVTVKNKMKNMTVSERKKKYGKSGKSNGMYGRKHTEESKQKMSENSKGYIRSTSSIDKQKKTFKKNYNNMSEEERSEKWGKSGKDNNFYNKTHTEETKKILSEKRKGKKPTNMRKVEINGVIYESLNEASKVTGIKTTTIWHRIKSKNVKYKNYNYVV